MANILLKYNKISTINIVSDVGTAFVIQETAG